MKQYNRKVYLDTRLEATDYFSLSRLKSVTKLITHNYRSKESNIVRYILHDNLRT